MTKFEARPSASFARFPVENSVREQKVYSTLPVMFAHQELLEKVPFSNHPLQTSRQLGKLSQQWSGGGGGVESSGDGGVDTTWKLGTGFSLIGVLGTKSF